MLEQVAEHPGDVEAQLPVEQRERTAHHRVARVIEHQRRHAAVARDQLEGRERFDLVRARERLGQARDRIGVERAGSATSRWISPAWSVSRNCAT